MRKFNVISSRCENGAQEEPGGLSEEQDRMLGQENEDSHLNHSHVPTQSQHSVFVIFFPVFYLHHNCESQINILLYIVLCLNLKN